MRNVVISRTFQNHAYGAVFFAMVQNLTIPKDPADLTGTGIGTQVIIRRSQTQQGIPHAAADRIGLKACSLQCNHGG